MSVTVYNFSSSWKIRRSWTFAWYQHLNENVSCRHRLMSLPARRKEKKTTSQSYITASEMTMMMTD